MLTNQNKQLQKNNKQQNIREANFMRSSKISFDLDMQNVDPAQVENYLKTITIIPEDFDEPFQRRKNKNNIIRISKQEIQKVIQEQQQQQTIQEAPKKQKRKYNKKSSEEKQVQKRKRRTKKEMEEARMLELKQL